MIDFFFIKQATPMANKERKVLSGSLKDSAAPSEPAAARIDEKHAFQLARHLADLYKRRRFTDLKARFFR